MLTSAVEILNKAGYRVTGVVKRLPNGDMKHTRLEVFGGGIQMEKRIEDIKQLLPDYKVQRGDQDNIFITSIIP